MELSCALTADETKSSVNEVIRLWGLLKYLFFSLFSGGIKLCLERKGSVNVVIGCHGLSKSMFFSFLLRGLKSYSN